MHRTAIAIGAGLLAAGAVTSAAAQRSRADIVVQISVPHGDLDLASEAGAKAMLVRLDKAASKACGGKPMPVMALDQVGHAKKREYQRCKLAAMDRGTLQLGAPRVRAAWLGEQSGSPAGLASPAATGAR